MIEGIVVLRVSPNSYSVQSSKEEEHFFYAGQDGIGNPPIYLVYSQQRGSGKPPAPSPQVINYGRDLPEAVENARLEALKFAQERAKALDRSVEDNSYRKRMTVPLNEQVERSLKRLGKPSFPESDTYLGPR